VGPTRPGAWSRARENARVDVTNREATVEQSALFTLDRRIRDFLHETDLRLPGTLVLALGWKVALPGGTATSEAPRTVDAALPEVSGEGDVVDPSFVRYVTTALHAASVLAAP